MSRQDIAKEIQLLRDKNLSYQKIADTLNERKIGTISGRGKWNKGSVSKVLAVSKDVSKVKHHKNDLIKELKQVKQINSDLQNQLNKVKQDSDNESIKVKHEKEELIKELHQVKQTNSDLQNRLNMVKQDGDNELVRVKHEKEELIKELKQVKQTNSDLQNRLNMVKQDGNNELLKVKQREGEKSKMSIKGWNVQKSGGYYRLFKKIAGKVHGIYLGKTINQDVAKKKISIYMERL